MSNLTKIVKLPEFVAVATEDEIDPKDQQNQVNTPTRTTNDLTPEKILEHPPNRGLVVYLPQEKVSKKPTKSSRLYYDLYAPQSYLIPVCRNLRIYYLCIKEIKVVGKGHLCFKSSMDSRYQKGKGKAILRDCTLYIPAPRDFYGLINKNQHLRTLRIIPSKHSIVHLYRYNPSTESTSTVGTYNSKINEIDPRPKQHHLSSKPPRANVKS